MSIPQFKQLYVVSDLHMGGATADKQIFKEGARLGNFIDYLTGLDVDGPLGLVINGDVVDFIAEPKPELFDRVGALDRLKRIYTDPAFAPVFQALERFVQKAGRSLVLVLGNHDVELALPPVRHWLLEELSGGDDAARGRITAVFDGTGFLCEVGGKRALCLHGNEVDPWNVIDYRLLLVMSRELNRTKQTTEWDACAGTHMVIDVMNDIKRDYPFVDLLKPEEEATLAILLTIEEDPLQFERLGKGARIFKKLKRDKRRIDDQLLGAPMSTAADEGAENDRSDLEAIRDFVAERFGSATTPAPVESADQLFEDVFNDIEQGREPVTDGGGDDGELLGARSLVMSRVLEAAGLISADDKRETLRKELITALEKDQTFNPLHRSESYADLDELAGSDIDYLITGHTHLARSFARNETDANGGWHFNSGTWARLMELPLSVLGDPDEFERVYRGFRTLPLTRLDEVNVPQDQVGPDHTGADPDEYDYDDPSDPRRATGGWSRPGRSW